MLVEIVIFSGFSAKKLKKARNLQHIFAKNTFFKFAPEHWSTVLFPKKLSLIFWLLFVRNEQNHYNFGSYYLKYFC